MLFIFLISTITPAYAEYFVVFGGTETVEIQSHCRTHPVYHPHRPIHHYKKIAHYHRPCATRYVTSQNYQAYYYLPHMKTREYMNRCSGCRDVSYDMITADDLDPSYGY
jgi:hypothetical protein